ncbi:MAG: (2Fe-2S) ferredoxin domain-containing protein [Leptolyngbyaceae cyanobacterium]
MATAIASKARFCLEGRFLGFVPGASPRKFLMVQTSDGEISVKLSKALRLMLHNYLVTGDWIRLVGKQKLDADTQELRYKAQEVIKIQPPQSSDSQLGTKQVTLTPRHKPKRILVCTKSDCRKRGSNTLCRLLEKALAESGRSGQVTIKKTGCMDRCKSGPHLVFMPGKQRYSRATADMLPDLMNKHL